MLRVSHCTVVAAWRERDRALRRGGADVALISAERWNEGGTMVRMQADGDDFVTTARTWGSHPNLFVFDPRPIWRELRRRPPRILDVHEEPCGLAAAELRILRRLFCPQAKLLLFSAQNIFKRYPLPIRMIEQAALNAASGIYVCNEEAVRILRRKGFTGTIAVLPLGVDFARFAPAPVGDTVDASRGRPGLRLGYVGRIEQRKGVQVVLAAMADEPAWTLDVVGDGPDAAWLREQVDAAGLTSRVHVRGFVDNLALPDLYRTFDVLVVPSLPTPRWDEQFCRVAVEAMACGVPVVASATGALPEVVAEGGLMFPPGDAAGLHEVLGRLDRDGAGRRALGVRAREWARRFDWDEVAAGHRRLYETVLG